MPTKQQLETQLSRERQKTQLIAGLVQRLQQRLLSTSQDVQAHVAHVQTQLNDLDAATDNDDADAEAPDE